MEKGQSENMRVDHKGLTWLDCFGGKTFSDPLYRTEGGSNMVKEFLQLSYGNSILDPRFWVYSEVPEVPG